MNDQTNPQHTSSRRFIKGVHRASFSPVDADASYEPPPPPVPTPVKAAPPAPVVTVLTTPAKKKTFKAGKFFLTLLIIALVGGAGYGYYLYWNTQQQLNALRVASPGKITQLQDQSIIEKVRSHMDIPSDTPIINTITNADQLRNQLFFAKAKNGDVVLVFTERAILYRPSEDKIIEVAAVSAASPTPASKASGAATASGTVLMNNGK